jgi:putative flavoprotein involved in K+ transport
MLPQRILGRDLFWWLTRLGFMRVNTATRLGRRLQARGEFVIGTNRRRLKRAGVRSGPPRQRQGRPRDSPTAAASTSAS